MRTTLFALAMAWLAAALSALGGTVATEDFENGYTDGEPLRVHADWFFEEGNDDPTCEDDAGLGGGWGVAKGDRAFAWVAKSFDWNDAKLRSVTFGGDWQTDSEGRLDDDRAGWSISNEDDSSDNTFGVQMDPGGSGEGGLNIEAYWDGDSFGDDGGRKSIVELPKLKADTWYRLRAKFTKLSATSAKIEVTFVELDDSGKPTGDAVTGSIADTSLLPDTEGEEIPNQGYFTPRIVWPVFKNYRELDGGFDNAYFEIEDGSEGPSEAVAAEPEPAPEPKPEPEPAPEPESE